MISADEIKTVISGASKYPCISRVGVFGSYARGTQISKSDVDILFDYDRMDDTCLSDVLDYGEELDTEFAKHGISIDYVSYKGVMDSQNNRSRKNILSDVIWIYERSEV